MLLKLLKNRLKTLDFFFDKCYSIKANEVYTITYLFGGVKYVKSLQCMRKGKIIW